MDYDLSQFLEDVIKGKHSEKVKKSLYGKVFDELKVCDGALLKGDWVFIPPKLTQRVNEQAHESHRLGETKNMRYHLPISGK